MKPSWTSEIQEKSGCRTTTFRPSTQSGTRYYQQSLADFSKAFWTVCTRCKLKKSEDLKYLLQVYAQETTFWLQEVWICGRLKLMAQRHLEQKIKDSHFKEINRDEDRPASGAPIKVKTKGKAKYNAKKQLRERRLHTLDHERSMFFWRFVRFETLTKQERQRQGTTSFTFSDRFTAPNFER